MPIDKRRNCVNQKIMVDIFLGLVLCLESYDFRDFRFSR